MHLFLRSGNNKSRSSELKKANYRKRRTKRNKASENSLFYLAKKRQNYWSLGYKYALQYACFLIMQILWV